MADSEILIEIKGSAKEFLDALEQIKDKSNSLEKQFEILTALSAAAFAGSAAEITLSTEAYGKQEIAINKLSQTLQAQGIYSDELRDKYVETAEALEQKTGADSAAILSGQGILQSMIGQKEISAELTEGIVNLSTRTGDLNSAFELVGKAVNGHAKELKNMGIFVDETADRETRLKQVTEGLSATISGAAESQVKDLGSIKLLHAAYEELQKKIGEEFAPVITKGIQLFTELFQTIAAHQELINIIVALTAATAVVGALGIGVGAGALAFFKLQEALQAAKIAMSALEVVTKGFVAATGIGLLLIAVTEIYLHWNTIWPAMQGIFTAFVNNIGSLAGGLGNLLAGVFTFRPEKIREGLDEIKASFNKSLKDYDQATEDSHKRQEQLTQDHVQRQNGIEKAAADAREKERDFEDGIRKQKAAANIALSQAEAEQASKATIDLKKQEIEILTKLEDEKYKAERSALETQLENNRQLQSEQNQLNLDQEKAYFDQRRAINSDYDKLSEQERAAFDLKYRKDLQAQIDNERTAKQKLAKDEIQLQINLHNEFLKNQEKFGLAYAAIDEAMHSEIYKGTKSAFGDLAALQNSNNATLKAIGKAAAIANITIKTAESAMNVFEGFSTIPFVGTALGIAAAAAVIAYGAEQIGQVTAAADGGLLQGGIPGKDSIHLLGMPGELVVPTRSYEEVVTAVADQRNAQAHAQSQAAPAQVGSAHIMISLKNDLMNFIEAKLVERRALGISLQGAR